MTTFSPGEKVLVDRLVIKEDYLEIEIEGEEWCPGTVLNLIGKSLYRVELDEAVFYTESWGKIFYYAPQDMKKIANKDIRYDNTLPQL